MTPRCVTRLRLDQFRSYHALDVAFDGRPVWLAGPNGAGKTNILEAISLMGGGRSLRGSAVAACVRHGSPQPMWTVAGTVRQDGMPRDIGARLVASGAIARREVHVDGLPTTPGRAAAVLALVWATPAHDRLFVEGASERRRFFDRLIAASDPAHGPRVARYERLLRERLATLALPAPDPLWLDAIEGELALLASAINMARTAHLLALQQVIDARPPGAFPKADLALSPTECSPEAFRAARRRDAEAGRSLVGPQRADVIVHHRPTGHAAALCSTGEQKALLYGIILARVRLSETDNAEPPIVLLDEAMAHFDSDRRAALADEICDVGAQVFMTGVEAALFTDFGCRAQGWHVEQSRLTSGSPL